MLRRGGGGVGGGGTAGRRSMCLYTHTQNVNRRSMLLFVYECELSMGAVIKGLHFSNIRYWDEHLEHSLTSLVKIK